MTQIDLNIPSTDKIVFYRELCDRLSTLLSSETDTVANSANAASLLFHTLPDINWAGFYLADEDSLLLGPFQGKPACTRIAMGQGVCGAAAAERKTIVVPDTSKFEGHIVCDSASRSEIVVPLVNWGRLIGVLDVDSPVLNRFDEDDREGLESVASVFIAATAGSGDMPELGEDEPSE